MIDWEDFNLTGYDEVEVAPEDYEKYRRRILEEFLEEFLAKLPPIVIQADTTIPLRW